MSDAVSHYARGEAETLEGFGEIPCIVRRTAQGRALGISRVPYYQCRSGTTGLLTERLDECLSTVCSLLSFVFAAYHLFIRPSLNVYPQNHGKSRRRFRIACTG